jgi:hypothetical protein
MAHLTVERQIKGFPDLDGRRLNMCGLHEWPGAIFFFFFLLGPMVYTSLVLHSIIKGSHFFSKGMWHMYGAFIYVESEPGIRVVTNVEE